MKVCQAESVSLHHYLQGYTYPMLKKLKIYFELFSVFFKIGAFTFGGGWAMISIIEKEVVGKKNWISKEEFVDALAIS